MTTKEIEKKSNIKEDRHFVTALSRGLDVLACFRSGQKLLGNKEIRDVICQNRQSLG